MKILKSRMLLGIICIALAAAIALVMLPRLYREKAETVHIIKAAQDIPVGTVLTKEQLVSAEVGAYGLPANVIRDPSEAVGMVAGSPVLQNEYLTSSRLITAEEYAARIDRETKGLTDGICLAAIQAPSVSAGGAGVLQAGDVVDVYAATKSEDGVITTEKMLQNMHIYSVLNSTLQITGELLEDGKTADPTPTYIIFRCTESEATTLISLEKAQTLHLTLTETGR